MDLVYADDDSSRELAGLGPRFSFTACPHPQGFVCTITHENNDTDKNNANENGDENTHESQYENPNNDSDSDSHSAAVIVYPSPPPTASTQKRSVPLPGPASNSSSGSSAGCSKQNAQHYHFGGILDSPVVLMKHTCPCAPSGFAGAWAPLPSIVGPGPHNAFPLSPPPTIPTPTHALPPASPRPSSSLLLPIPEDDQSSDDYGGGGDERRSTALQLLSPLSPEWTSNRRTPEAEAGDGDDVQLDERSGEAGDSVLMAQDDADAGTDDSDVLAARGGFGRPALHPLDIPMSASRSMFPLSKAEGPHEDLDGAHLLLGFGVMPPHLQLQGDEDAAMQMPLSPASLRSTTSFGSLSPSSACSSGSFSSFDSHSSASELELELDDLGMDMDDHSSSLSVSAWGPPSPPSSLYPSSPYTYGYGAPLAGPSSYHSPALRALPLLSPPPKASPSPSPSSSFFHENDEAKYEEEELEELDLDMELGLGFGMSSSPSPSRRAVARLPELEEDADAPFFDFNRGNAFDETGGTDALGDSGADAGSRIRMMEDADTTLQLEPPDPPHVPSLWGQDVDLASSTAGDTDSGNALHLSLPLPSASDPANKAFSPPPSILDGYTPAELVMRLPSPDADASDAPRRRMREELEGLLAVRARARVALAACQQSASSSPSSTPSASSSASASPTSSPSASPSPEPQENGGASGSGSAGPTPTVLDHELRRTVPRDAGEPRRRRKRAKELGREVDALVGLRLGLLPPPVVVPVPVVAPVSVFAAPAALASDLSGDVQLPDVEQQQKTQKQPQLAKPHNIRRDKAGLAGLASVPQLVARMILRRRERCVRGLDGGAGKAGRGRGASPLRVGVVFGEDDEEEEDGEAQDAEMDVDVDL
ncbi:hypothetical protein C8F04DRAFT_110838 [Mycena alexandri]|uniref:Uncharacterized protein n=1 Tax=Mycena alexandri TaxID=1745969 RepID=A0AAD6TDD0_9AGAR|nr:hypothetical protein C8F04DRAFT_110838 [Mycena alexandri]